MLTNPHDQDPDIFGHSNPSGNQSNMAITAKVNVRKLNKKGIMLVGGALCVTLLVGMLTFNQMGGKGSEKPGAAGKKPQAGPQPVSRESMWYNKIPDTPTADNRPVLAAPGAAGAGASPAVDNAAVPDLTGKAVNPMAATFASTTTAPSLKANAGSPAINAAAGPIPTTTGQPVPNLASAKVTPAAAPIDPSVEAKRQQRAQAYMAPIAAGGFQSAESTAISSPAALPNLNHPAETDKAHGPIDSDPNGQARKEQFLKQARQAVDPDYHAELRKAPLSDFEVKAGSVIPAVMIGGINSDLPGQVIAQVRESVYDTKTGRYVLIPMGSRLVGLYDSNVTYGQRRVLLAWNRIIYPDGSSYDLRGMPGADLAGYAGFSDKIDNHYGRIFGSAILMSLISAGTQLSQPQASNVGVGSVPSVSQTVAGALGQQLGQVGLQITQKNLNIQPTLEVRPGYPFNVMVTADMILPRYVRTR